MNNNNDFEKFMSERIRNKSEHERYLEFEHQLRYLLCDLTDTDIKDSFLLSDIKQTVIVFLMKDKFGESNNIFLSNMKNDFYTAIDKLEEHHVDIKSRTMIIKMFMEDFYFNE